MPKKPVETTGSRKLSYKYDTSLRNPQLLEWVNFYYDIYPSEKLFEFDPNSPKINDLIPVEDVLNLQDNPLFYRKAFLIIQHTHGLQYSQVSKFLALLFKPTDSIHIVFKDEIYNALVQYVEDFTGSRIFSYEKAAELVKDSAKLHYFYKSHNYNSLDLRISSLNVNFN